MHYNTQGRDLRSEVFIVPCTIYRRLRLLNRKFDLADKELDLYLPALEVARVLAPEALGMECIAIATHLGADKEHRPTEMTANIRTGKQDGRVLTTEGAAPLTRGGNPRRLTLPLVDPSILEVLVL